MPTTVKATELGAPPEWAVMQRRLLSVMEEAASLTVEKYVNPAGIPYFADDVDDLYERFYNWGLFYAMGGSEEISRIAFHEYDTITSSNGDDTRNPIFPELFPQLHDEYYSLHLPAGKEASWIPGQRIITDWHHMGEGNQLFYGLGLADHTYSANIARAKRFASIMIGENLEAPNYDSDLNQFRSVYTDGKGPIFDVNVEQVKGFLHGGSPTEPGWTPKPMGVRTTLFPVIKNLEKNWFEDPVRAKSVVDTFSKVVMRGDIPHNLAATALVTNAYLYTGEEKYKTWVLRYTEGWLDRMRKNDGIMPDNIGPTGKIGEYRGGQWWGGWYGWNCYKGNTIGLNSIMIGAECAHLLTGDDGYLDLIRSQMDVLLDNAKIKQNGQINFSWRYGPNGWSDYQAMSSNWLPHLYHASMSAKDHEKMIRVREGDVERDWGVVSAISAKAGGDWPFFHFHDGKFPDWPVRLMEAELLQAEAKLQAVRAESRTPEQIISDNSGIPNPVLTEGLTQMMFGAPGTVYNGGLLRATVRYFDLNLHRPGLPPDVAALVDGLERDRVGIKLVNLSDSEKQSVVIQAGAFGEHSFTNVSDNDAVTPVNGKYFSVELPPGTSIHLDCGTQRFANAPSYAFPWPVR